MPLDALPFGPFDPERDRTLELGLRRWVREKTGIEIGYVEQLYTFGNRNRDPGERRGGPRVISVAYLALVREGPPSRAGEARVAGLVPPLPLGGLARRASRRHRQPDRPGAATAGSARRPTRDMRRERQERCDIYFGLGGAPWVAERVLDRYELLYEMGLAAEAERDRRRPKAGAGGRHESLRAGALGQPMAFDHRRILATALGRLRGKLKYRPVVFELLPQTFTLLQLQRTVEALAGIGLHKQNLRRLVESGGLVEGTGRMDIETGGRPAETLPLPPRRAAGTPRPGRRHFGTAVRLARRTWSRKPVDKRYAQP